MVQHVQHIIKQNLVAWIREYRVFIEAIYIIPFLILFFYLSLSEPTLNWDIIAYVANAMQYISDKPVAEIQHTIYTSLQHSVPVEDLADFTNSSSRVVLSTDPEAFDQTIKFFYDARVVYIGILAALMKLGMDPFFATYFISTTCSVLSILLLLRLIPVQLPLGLCFALPFVALACGLLNVARLSSPDALAALVTISMYWLVIRNKVTPILVVIPISIFVRTDLILLMPMFLGYLYFSTRAYRLFIVLSAISTVIAYIVLNNVIVDADPWSSLIGYNYGVKPTHPADYVFPVSIADYFSYFIMGLKSFSYNPLFFMFCALAITGVFLFSSSFFFNPKNKPISDQHSALLFLLVSCVAYVATHFILFPVTWIRFFAAQYTLVSVVVLWAALSILAERNYSGRENVNLLGK